MKRSFANFVGPSSGPRSATITFFAVSTSAIVLLAAVSVSACTGHCRNAPIINVGENWDGVNYNGWTFSPYLSQQSLLSNQSDGSITDLTVDVDQWQAATDPACVANGVWQDGTVADPNAEFVGNFNVAYKCVSGGASGGA